VNEVSKKLQVEFKTCVSDTEIVLQTLSKMANLPYEAGAFSKFEDSFVDSKVEEDFFVMEGACLKVQVHLEKYEGYFFITIYGAGKDFEHAKNYLLNKAH